MQMEAETLSMLIWGFGIVMVPIIIGIIAL
jgi:hypothetical protein